MGCMTEVELGRALEADSMNKDGAHRLAGRIRDYWFSRGYEKIDVWVLSEDGYVYVVRSNMVYGVPPR